MSVICLSSDNPEYLSNAIAWCEGNVTKYSVMSHWPQSKISVSIADEKEAVRFILRWMK